MRQSTQPSPCAAPSTYSVLHPAHRRSRLTPSPRHLLRHLAGEPSEELLDGDAPLGPLAPPCVDTDAAGSDVIVPDHEHVGKLLELGPSDAGADRLAGGVDVDTEAALAEPGQHLGCVVRVVIAHRQDARLHWRQPSREVASGVLDEHTEEPVERSEQGAVDDAGAVPGVVGTDVLD